jgi:hypothetical protein
MRKVKFNAEVAGKRRTLREKGNVVTILFME